MDKELFRKTEGKLYRYYRQKRKIEGYNRQIETLERSIEEIEQNIRDTNVTIDYFQNGQGIEERVQTSSTGSSYAESQIIKAITSLEKELGFKTRKIVKLKAKVRETKEFISYMEYNLSMLEEEDKQFIELKYGDGRNIIYISQTLNIAQATCYRKREELIHNIAQFENLIKK
ncbi:hypothetical protein SAMN02745248_02422 [Hathewaya proteolytica DSM 3090]|uniref:Phage transcriptional regulator, RinA family n=1 Tax=Hathewaya proteolytica DSM 3090 TaxID=1121331 RepID=A0A1M6S1H6_9CLOT|nr:hypothetical protein [Hathewaya proteolytica]SHK38535.1 hypothetical protein SAMN02745248_02422 [Hathewaya proteolytica DSM 3090]